MKRLSTNNIKRLQIRLELKGFSFSSENKTLEELLKNSVKTENDLFYFMYLATGKPLGIEEINSLFLNFKTDFVSFNSLFLKSYYKKILFSIKNHTITVSHENDIYSSVTFTSKCHFNTGIQRTVRQICIGLNKLAPQDFNLVVFKNSSFQKASKNETDLILDYQRKITHGNFKRIKFVKTKLVASYHFLNKIKILSFFARKSKNFLRLTTDKIFNYSGSEKKQKQEVIVFSNGKLFIPELFISRENDALPSLKHFTNIEIIGLCYDVMPLTHPEYFNHDNSYFTDIYLDGLKYFSKISCISNYTNKSLRSVLNDLDIQTKKSIQIETHYLGCNLEFIKNTENTIAENNILSIGSVDKRKNYIGNIQAVSVLAKKFPKEKFKYNIVGGPGKDFEKIEGLITKTNRKHSNIEIILHGSLHDTKVNELYNKTKLTLYSSFAEGFGLPLIESAALSIPYISSNITATKEIGSIIKGGLLIDPHNPLEIADALETLFFNDEVYNTKKLELAEFKWDRWSDYSEKILKFINQ